MSDYSQGQGWWQASDGKWYPPDPGADATQAIPTQTYTETTYSIPPPPRSGLRLWHLLAAAVLSWLVGLVMGVGIGSAGDGDGDTVASVASSTTQPTVVTTTSTTQATTTTARPTTTLPPTTTTPPTTAPPAPRELLRVSGDSDKKTAAFNVRSGWTLRWDIGGQAKSSGMNIIVIDEMTGRDVEDINIESNGDTIVRVTCRCYLDIRTYGETYTVTVTGVPT